MTPSPACIINRRHYHLTSLQKFMAATLSRVFLQVILWYLYKTIPYLVSLHFVIYRLSDTSLMGCWFLRAFSKTYLMMMVHYDWSEIWSQILHIKLHYWVSLWLRVATQIDQTVQNSGEHHYPPILLTKRLCRMLYTPWLKLTLPLATSAIIIANFANSYATLEL